MLPLSLFCQNDYIFRVFRHSLENTQILTTIEQLEDGIEIYLFTSDNGKSILSSDITNASTYSINATFTVQLKHYHTDMYYLYWKATVSSNYSGLKNVSGTLYVTNFTGDYTFHYANIDCPNLNGTTYIASNTTEDFPIASHGVVWVGFENVYLQCISQVIYIGNGSSAVTY